MIGSNAALKSKELITRYPNNDYNYYRNNNSEGYCDDFGST